MQKLFWLIVIIIVSYILLVFNAPDTIAPINKLLNIERVKKKAINFKKTFYKVITKIPTKEELKWAYSWIVDKVDKTKETIDTIREKANDLENKYNDTCLLYSSPSARDRAGVRM